MGNSRTSRRRGVILARSEQCKQAVSGLRGLSVAKRPGIEWGFGPHAFRSLPAHIFQSIAQEYGATLTAD
jgi:hypothetical protein